MPVGSPNKSASVPCTCGELFQGSLRGEACLVSCPIAIYSTANLLPADENRKKPGKKVQFALSKLPISSANSDSLSITRNLPAGRGYGTSTADIGAALYALASQACYPLTAQQAARIAVSVEPSDSTIFPGLTLFAHKTGNFFQSLGAAPQAKILILDPGGYVDTEQFNAQDWSPQLKKLSGEHLAAFELLKEGITSNDLFALGQASTLSAHLHQEILYNPLLEKMIKFSAHIHAAGICRAHSGTILGFLLEPEQDDDALLIEFCRKRFSSGVRFRMTSLVNGGARISLNSQYQLKGVPD